MIVFEEGVLLTSLSRTVSAYHTLKSQKKLDVTTNGRSNSRLFLKTFLTGGTTVMIMNTCTLVFFYDSSFAVNAAMDSTTCVCIAGR